MTGFKCSDDIIRAESIHFCVHFLGVVFIQRQHHPLQRKSSTISFTPIIHHFSNSLKEASRASQMAQAVKNPPSKQETWVPSLSWEDPLEEGMATHPCILAWRIPMDRGAWWATVYGITKSRTRSTATMENSVEIP